MAHPAFATLLLILATPAFAQAPDNAAQPPAAEQASPESITASASPDRVRLGDEFVFTIEIKHGGSERYELPAPLSLGKDFDVIKVDQSRTGSGDSRVTRFTIRAALFALGDQRIADLELPVTTPQGLKKLSVPGPKVVGEGDLKEDEKAELQDIQPPVEVSVPRYWRLLVAAGVLALIAAGLYLWRWLRNRPAKAKVIPVAPPLPLHDRTLQALEALQREDLPGQSKFKEFHFRLSEIVRGYLGERFGFNAIDQTTEELLSALSRMPTPGLDYARFEAFCREGDLVKFAKAEATPTSCKTAIEAAFVFVRATMPVPQTPRPTPTQGAAA